MTLIVRPLPTPHDPPAGPVTVATPSCCCCCCCCLATLGTAAGFTAGAAYETAVRRRRPRALPTVMAALALPLALVVLVGLINTFDDLPGHAGAEDELAAVAWVVAIAVFLGTAGGALRLAGAGWGQAAGVPAAVVVCVPVMFVVELPMVLLTAFIVELASPAAVVFGVWFGRRTHRGADQATWPAAVWVPPDAPPPALPPPAWSSHPSASPGAPSSTTPAGDAAATASLPDSAARADLPALPRPRPPVPPPPPPAPSADGAPATGDDR